MFIKHLELNNFRNYKECSIDFPSQKTLIVGKNAQGKTNLLEAVYFLALLNSTRTNNDNELILLGQDLAQIKADIIKNDNDFNLEVIINPPKKKILKIDGVKKTKFKEFLGFLKVVNFSVNDLLLLRGTPQDRRDWLDNAISQVYLGYYDRLLKYNKIKTQRNNLLKDFKGNINISNSQKELLSVFDEQIIVAGSNLIYLRQKYLKEIQKTAVLKHKEISETEDFYMSYNSTITGNFDCRYDNELETSTIYNIYKEKLAQKLNEEIIRGQTVIGAHRDDISFYINNIESKSYASQGQQRTIVLSLKLAELEFLKEKTGEYPVLLLDDVLAELDNTRQNYLLNSISDEVQTIISSVDTLHFAPQYLEGVKIYNIKDGKIIE